MTEREREGKREGREEEALCPLCWDLLVDKVVTQTLSLWYYNLLTTTHSDYIVLLISRQQEERGETPYNNSLTKWFKIFSLHTELHTKDGELSYSSDHLISMSGSWGQKIELGWPTHCLSPSLWNARLRSGDGGRGSRLSPEIISQFPVSVTN